MMTEHVSFVILNYCSTDITVQCVESIKENIIYENYSIVIVDNGSTNNSGEILKERYNSDSRIAVLCLNENVGFAKGNNKGYQYAKDVFKAQYVIITNSDTIFEQNDFIECMQKLYDEEKYHILGPDLITPSGMHQNPHREHMYSKSEVRKMLFVKSVFLYYFKLKKFLHLENKINILEYWYEKKDKKTEKGIKYTEQKSNIVPLGACLIFSPAFVAKERDAFYSKTFMYGEEDIMAYLCKKKGYKILYSPNISVFHLNGEITKNKYGNSLEKNIFTYTYIVEGCKILLELMRMER